MSNAISTIDTIRVNRASRRNAYKRAALAELSAKVGSTLAEVALSLALAEIWEDHAAGVVIDVD